MTTQAANDASPISFWSAEFVDPAMEQAYQKHTQAETVRFLRISLRLWAVILLVFGLPDWTALGASEGFYVLTSLRIAHAALLLWLSWRLLSRPDWASLGWPVTIVAILGYPLFFVYPLYMPDTGTLGFAVILLMLLSMYVFIPNRLMLTNLIALVGIVGVISSRLLLGATSLDMVVTVMLLLWPAVLGYAAAQRINTEPPGICVVAASAAE